MRILIIPLIIAIFLLGCETKSNNKIPTITDDNLTDYNIPTNANIIGFVETTGYPAVKWTYMHTCYMTTISRTYQGNFVSNTFPFPCE